MALKVKVVYTGYNGPNIQYTVLHCNASQLYIVQCSYVWIGALGTTFVNVGETHIYKCGAMLLNVGKM